jgi:CRISPR-associated protein Csy2
MTECPDFDHLLLIPRLRVWNANAISSPLTHGFPSMTAFLGLMWALERKTAAAGLDLRFRAIGVVCHRHQEQATDDEFVKSFYLTRNPVGKDGGTAAIVEEGRIHLDISLVFAVQSEALTQALDARDAQNGITRQVRDSLLSMRVAGGGIAPSSRQPPEIVAFTGPEEARREQFQRLKYRLLPGYALVARDDLLDARHAELQTENPAATRLDAWLSLARVEWRAGEEGKNGKTQWRLKRERKGWIVPIPVGYGVLSGPHAPGAIANARDATTPFCFVEGLYSIGEWRGPHRLQSPRELLWYADHQAAQGVYRCRNDYRTPVEDGDGDGDDL